MLELIFDALDSFFEFVGEIISWLIEGFINLVDHVVDYFKGLMLRKGRDIPFIADENHQKIRQLIKQAPQKKVGIFEATYNEDTDEIENYRSIEADGLDNDIKDILQNEPLVVLS